MLVGPYISWSDSLDSLASATGGHWAELDTFVGLESDLVNV